MGAQASQQTSKDPSHPVIRRTYRRSPPSTPRSGARITHPRTSANTQVIAVPRPTASPVRSTTILLSPLPPLESDGPPSESRPTPPPAPPSRRPFRLSTLRLELQDNALNLSGELNKKFTLFACERSNWLQKFQDRYRSDTAKRAEKTDDYLTKPPSATTWTTFKPLEKRALLPEPATWNVLPEAHFLGRDLNEIPIPITRGRDLIACRAGGVVFYPVIGKLRVFARCVYFRYENLVSDAHCDNPETTHPVLFLAIPLDVRGCLVTGELFTSFTPSGIGWVPYRGNKSAVGHWLARAIDPTVQFRDVRPVVIRPLPTLPDPEDSHFAILRTKARTARKALLVALDQGQYVGKAFHDIPFQIPDGKELLVGKCKFWSLIPNFVATRVHPLQLMENPPDELPLSRSGLIPFAFRIDDAACAFTDVIWCWGNFQRPQTWAEYAGDVQRIFGLIARKIHESVKVGRARAPQAWIWRPIQEPNDSYKSQLTRKCANARKEGMIELPKERYTKKQLHEIRLELATPSGCCSCKVGNLVFYPVAKGRYVVIRGGDLYPPFESFWFGFRLAKKCIKTKVIYGASDRGWQPYAPENAAYRATVLAFVQHAIANTRRPTLAQEECAEMVAAYRASSDFARKWVNAQTSIAFHTPTEQLQSMLDASMPVERKIVQLGRFLRGSLYPVDWETLTPLLSHPLLVDKSSWIQEAKKETFTAIVGRDQEYEAKMLCDREIQVFASSQEIRELRAERAELEAVHGESG